VFDGSTLCTAAAAADDDDDDDDVMTAAAIHSLITSPSRSNTARNVDLSIGLVTSSSRVNSRRDVTPVDDVTSCRATTRSLLS